LLFDDTSYEAEELLDSAKLGANYLITATNADGSFDYEYDALNDTYSSSYNILRHSGTIYSMLQIYDVTRNQELLTAAEKAIDYLLSHKKSYLDNTYVIVEKDEIKLGGNALAILALTEHVKTTNNQDYLQDCQELARFINYSQKESGEFISKRYYSTGEISDFVSGYYPGEALLALCRLYSLDGDETWLDIAEKGAKYLINIRDAGIKTNDLTHDHWLTMSLNELYRYRNDELYYNHCMRLAESIMHAQRDNEDKMSKYPEWLGSYYTPPRSTPTACRSEGLVAAYHLANDQGDNETAERILKSLKLGIEFQLRCQFKQEDVEDLPDPDHALGGFHGYLNDYEIRIDYVQHNICSILGLWKILNA
jgi:uncharacterized protein YyaL (SSP411 family)